MGNYLYSVRAKNIQVDGLTVHALTYLAKPSYNDWDRLDRNTAMKVGKAEAYWASKPAPKFVSVTPDVDFVEFQPVMSWDGRATCDDTPRFEGATAQLGFLKQTGKKSWTLVQEFYVVTIGTMQPGTVGETLYIRTSGQFFTKQEADAFAATKQDGETVRMQRTSIQDGKYHAEKVAA